MLVSKETLVLGRWEKEKNLVLSKRLIKVELPPWKIWKADVSNAILRSDKGLKLETSDLQIFDGCNKPLSKIP